MAMKPRIFSASVMESVAAEMILSTSCGILLPKEAVEHSCIVHKLHGSSLWLAGSIFQLASILVPVVQN